MFAVAMGSVGRFAGVLRYPFSAGSSGHPVVLRQGPSLGCAVDEQKKKETMHMPKLSTSVSLAGACVIGLAAVYLTTGGAASAVEKEPASAVERDPHDRGGPVVYLNRHGAPTQCNVDVSGTTSDGQPYKDGIYRRSCDGTLWMPQLKLGSSLSVTVRAKRPGKYETYRTVTVKEVRDENKLDVDNETAICFLAKAGGGVYYTNMSAKGGDCNGS